MTTSRRSRRPALAVLTAMALLAGCTGVPTRSLPETVESMGVGRQPPTAGGPTPGSPPIKLIKDFLAASTNDPVKHSTARKYLTPAARNRWSDTTVTIIANDEKVGTFDTAKGTVTVTGRKIGALDEDGVYTPNLDGTGDGGAAVPFVFSIKDVNGQNRISALNPGLLLTEQQFRGLYSQRTLYFFDTAERYLVPDIRYSPLTDANQVSDWMLGEMVQGAQKSLGSVVNTDPLVAQSQRISAKVHAAATTVQLPGARQLAPDVRNRLAAQVSTTLFRALNVGEISLVDGDRKVVIPQVGRTEFSAADFVAQQGPPKPASEVYYLRSGRIRTKSGKALPGPLGNGSTLFDSVALARPSSVGGALTVAGLQRAHSGVERLAIGTETGGVRPVALPPGRLTRPAWFPGLAEVWVGVGSKLYRATTDGRTAKVASIPIPSFGGGGRLVAVRPSPDGSRVALVVQGVDNQQVLYVAGVVRTGQTVQVDSPNQVSPTGAVVTDTAWIDPLKLYAIGYLAQSRDSEVYRVNIDGASWTNDGIGTLPNPPDSITMADGATPWVSAQGFVWELNGGTFWVSPVVTNGQTTGNNPIYLG